MHLFARTLVPLFILILCCSAFSEERGVIQCDSDSASHVPAWVAPDLPYVTEQLNCGQMVSVVGLERGYVKIQIGERFGYVDAKFVILPETLIPRTTEQEGQVADTAPSVGRHEGGLNFETSNVYYDEPHFARNKGFMYGVSGDYTFRPNDLMLKVDGRFSFGDVDYWGTGTAEGIRDYNFETRFSAGYDFKTVSKRASFTPFMGFGYRYLFNTFSSAGQGAYDRKSNYLYSPVGMETMFRMGSGWSLGLAGEYDLFWHGWQYSELKEAGIAVAPLKNDQNDGWGARGSVRILKNFAKIDFAIEPYFRYWDIEDSDLMPDLSLQGIIFLGGEPANTTTEWGLKVGIRF